MSSTRKLILSGNEAFALGARNASVLAATGYPGTPSTEILENLKTYDGVRCEWSVNEKVAFEVALGACYAGARTLVTMKHVGLNVAADALFTASYTGVKAGLVVVCADDPGMHSSQNEQDNRHYGLAAKVPILEPSDSQEAHDMTVLAFELSERFDTPVIIRSTTRVSHGASVVEVPAVPPALPAGASGFVRDMKKFVMIPAFARLRHEIVEKRMNALSAEANGWTINRTEHGDADLGIITSGISYQYCREAFPSASVLKLGCVHPLPADLLKRFRASVKRCVVVEELDPFIETFCKAEGLDVEGKSLLPITGEFDQDVVRRAILGTPPPEIPVEKIPARPPALCPGCPHRTVFQLLRDHQVTVCGDIGCYTLGVLPPWSAMDTCVEMGASIGTAQGIEIAMGPKGKGKTVAVLGDSTFAHSGLTGLVNAAYNRRTTLTIVLDNGTTAMTGMQPNPFSGKTIAGEDTVRIDYAKLADAVGLKPENVRIVNAYKPGEVEEALLGLLDRNELSLLVVMGPCVIAKTKGRA
jgi:indolepyruvate ferredoxin oxidoreductase alpha subunit